MKKIALLLVLLVGILVAVSACGQSQSEEKPSPQEEGNFRIEVSRNGFNNTAQDFRLEVEAGQEVEITFVYGDNDFPENNPHIIAIPALGITTGVLDQNNPQETVRFTAPDTEELVLFSFMCTQTACVGHNNLLGGIIAVE